MAKPVTFYNFLKDNKICEGLLVKDPLFHGGYKIVYRDISISIRYIKLKPEDE